MTYWFAVILIYVLAIFVGVSLPGWMLHQRSQGLGLKTTLLYFTLAAAGITATIFVVASMGVLGFIISNTSWLNEDPSSRLNFHLGLALAIHVAAIGITTYVALRAYHLKMTCYK